MKNERGRKDLIQSLWFIYIASKFQFFLPSIRSLPTKVRNSRLAKPVAKATETNSDTLENGLTGL